MALTSACKKDDDPTSTTDIQETAQQVGDAMASVDEAGGSSGALAVFDAKGAERTFARLLPEENRFGTIENLHSLVLPNSNAATCALANTFGSCSGNVITRTFGGCTIGSATLTGTVTLTWSDAASDTTCAIAADGHSITRVPNFTLTGRRGATLTVIKSATNGQVVTRTAAGVFSFANDGIRRTLTRNSSTLFDFSTTTTAALTITGSARTGRTLTSTGGAALRVTNHVSGVVCDYVPTNVTWASASCTCATSGSWAATCTDARASTLTITGCGTANFTMGGSSESLTFDRCY